MRLYVIGECHAYFGWYRIRQIDVPQFEQLFFNAIGSYTMSGFAFNKLKFLNISKSYIRQRNYNLWKTDPESEIPDDMNRLLDHYPYEYHFNIRNGDFVVFSMGEIDVRSHLSDDNYIKTWKEIVDKTIPEYFDAIKISQNMFDHLYMGVYNIVPPIKGNWGHSEEQNMRKQQITKYMNSQLKEYCEKYNYTFIDVYDKYCDDDGFLIDKLSAGSMHIGDPIYLIEFLNNLSLS
jgi:hypothetical protein